MSEEKKIPETTPTEETVKETNPAQERENTPSTSPSAAEKPQETVIDEPSKAIPKEKKSKKKLIIVIAAAAVIVIAVALVLIFTLGANHNADEEDDDELTPISDELNNFYSGVVEPQQTADVNKDADRSVDQVFVKVGDTVAQGDKLFSYNSGEIESKIATAKIELEGIQNDITENNNKISLYQRQRSEAQTEQEKLEFTANIQDEENAKSQNELQLKLKKSEIETMQQSLNNSVVTAPISGIIKQINNGSDPSAAYMTILMNGAFRVKGSVDETNVRSLAQGTKVTVHSRNVSGKTWSGTITKVDTDSNADSKQNNMYANDTGADSASKYYFYVTLDSTEDMLLGEHVYIEPLLILDEGADAESADVDMESTDAETADAAAANAQ